MKPPHPTPTQAGRIRKPLIVGAGLVLVVMVGAMVFRQKHPSPVAPSGDSFETMAEPVSPGLAKRGGEESVAAETASLAPPVSPAPSRVQSPPAAALATARAAATPESRALMTALTQIDLKSPVTLETAAAFRKNLEQLVRLGPDAVPALREFLELNKDLSFESVPGAAGALGAQTLRLSLLGALNALNSPEANALASQVLSSTGDPREIALIAANLVSQDADQYRGAAINAAREALTLAATGKLEGRDVGPLFDVFRQLGGSTVIPDLVQAAGGPWKYYATIALADLPKGAGVPALIEMASDPRSAGASARLPALQMLAQLAFDYPEARAAFLAQVQSGSIPASSWITLGTVLGGDRFEIGAIPPGASPDLKTWHIRSGNQNYFTYPNQSGMAGEQVSQRLEMINQLLAANLNNPVAVDSLNRAKASLSPARGSSP